MFNPQPCLQAPPLQGGHACLVIDGALLAPRPWRQWAGGQRSRLVASGLARPGLEHGLPPEPVGRIVGFGLLHLRAPLGGTSFHRARRGAAPADAMVHDSTQPDAAGLRQRCRAVVPGHLTGSNAWFDRVASVPAALNRAICCGGGPVPPGGIRHPDRPSGDPATGRLARNVLIRCRRAAR